MFALDYLFSLLTFVTIFFLERMVLLLIKKKPIWPFLSFSLLVDAVAYSAISLLIIGVVYLVFKKVDSFSLLYLDMALYLVISFVKPSRIYFAIKNKEKVGVKKNSLIGATMFVAILLECFLFNFNAYSDKKDTYQYENFVCEQIKSDGVIEKDTIILTNKQCVYITTNNQNFDNLYLSFNNNDMNLYVNIYTKHYSDDEYALTQFALIDPAIDEFGYIPLYNMDQIYSIKLEFDIDDSRYENNATKPVLYLNNISFDAYFPLTINPLRMILIFAAIIFAFNLKTIIVKNVPKENENLFKKLEKIVLFAGGAAIAIFFIHTLINSAAYFIKYGDLYLGGYESNNIYYQQFVAYTKGQLNIDGPVSADLLTAANPYNPYTRDNDLVLWDHAFYNGKYYSYYGHAPIYLVMLPIYWVSGFVPSNQFVLQLGVIFSIFAYLLAVIQIFKLFIKKTDPFFVTLTLIAMVLGSFLLANNTYEYGGMIYRIPYAYANGFLFLTIYLFIKGYKADKYRFLYFIFTALSLVFIVLSRPLEIIYLVLLIPLIIKMIKEDNRGIKQKLINYLPAIGIVLAGAIFVCVINYVRFENIFEFGEHYQITVTDCTKNTLSVDGVLPALYHFFLQAPTKNPSEGILVMSDVTKNFDSHYYVMPSIGMLFVPIAALCLLIPYVLKKEDSFALKFLLIGSPIIVLSVAFINYCFAGVCARYLNDVAPWMVLIGGLVALKALELNDGKHVIVPALICVTLIASIVLSTQYHFVEFDGLKIGDFGGLFGHLKTIFNSYNIH